MYLCIDINTNANTTSSRNKTGRLSNTEFRKNNNSKFVLEIHFKILVKNMGYCINKVIKIMCDQHFSLRSLVKIQIKTTVQKMLEFNQLHVLD